MYFYFNSTGWKSVPNWCPDRRTSNSSWLKIYFQKCCFRTSFLPSHHTHHHRRRRRRQWNKILFYLSIKQCDQMVRLFVQYLSIYIIKIFATVGSKYCVNSRKMTFKICQGGEISPNLVTLISSEEGIWKHFVKVLFRKKSLLELVFLSRTT